MSTSYPRIDYSARDFNTIKAAIENYIQAVYPEDYTDFTESTLGVMLIEVAAYVGDIMSFTADMQANEVYLPTATQRTNLVKIVNLIGYQPSPPTAASVQVSCERTEFTSLAATIPSATQIQVADLYFETLADFIIGAGVTSIVYTSGPTFYEGRSYQDTFDGTGAANQEYTVSNDSGIQNSYTITVDGTEWLETDALVFSGDENVYELKFDGNNTATVRFGNGVSGRIPPIGTDNIVVDYRVGGGEIGIIAANTIDTTITATTISGDISVTIANPASAQGGENEESIDSIKFNAPRYVRTHGNAITKSDYDSLASQFSDPTYGSIAKAVAYPRYGQTNSSANEVEVYAWALTVGGAYTGASAALRQKLYAYLKARAVLTVDIFVYEGNTTTIDMTINAYVTLTTQTASDIQTEIETTAETFFNRETLQPGETFYISELQREVLSIDGILQANIGIPGTETTETAKVDATFTSGLSTQIDLNTLSNPITVNQFAAGTLTFTSGVLSSQSYDILSNTIDQVTIDDIVAPSVGDTLSIETQFDFLQDIPVARDEIYTLGTLVVNVYSRSTDPRSTTLITNS